MSDDLISRRAAIDEFTNIGSNFVYGEFICKAVVSRLKQLPSIKPERKKGKWVSSRPDAPMFGYHYCSLCGRKRTSPKDHYCPNCGAEMEADDDEIH